MSSTSSAKSVCGGQLILSVLLTIACLLDGTEAAIETEPSDATIHCLKCIAYASTGGNKYPPCTDYCGPYMISDAYWIDAGRPGNVADFSQCALNMTCAETTVVSYMNRYQTDCDGDGQVTCIDYAKIHKLGPVGCRNPADGTQYWRQFERCMKRNSQKLDARRRVHPRTLGF